MRVWRWGLGCSFGLLIAALGIWAFHAYVLAQARETKNLLMYKDLFVLYYPMLDYAFSSLREGRLPLWNPYQLGGLPFLAILQHGMLYPLHLPYLFLPTHRAMELVTVLQIVLAGWLAALYVRRAFGVSRTAAFVAGAVFMVNTYTLYASFALNQLASLPWLPLLFLGVDQAIRTRRARWALAVGAGIALPILGGYLQLLTYEAYALLPYAMACTLELAREPGSGRRALRSIAILVLGSIIGLLLCAPQLLPTAEMSRLAVRSPHGLSAVQIQLMLPPPSLGMLLDGRREPLSYLSLSAIALLLAPFALSRAGTRPRAVAVAVVGMLAAFVSFGPWHPVGHAYLHLPTGDWFRHLQRAWPITTFCLGILGAIGLDSLIAAPSGRRRLWGTIAAVALTVGLVAVAPSRTALMVASSGLLVVCLVATGGGILRRRALAVALGALLVAELCLGVPINRDVLPYKGDAYAGMLVARPALERARFMSDGTRIYCQELFFEAPTAGKLGTLFRIPVFSDYEALVPARYEAWDARMTGHRYSTDHAPFMGNALFAFLPYFDARFLDYASVGQVILWNVERDAPSPPIARDAKFYLRLPLPRSEELGAWERITSISLIASLYRNSHAWPRAFIAHEVRRVRSGAEALDALARLPRGSLPLAIVESDPATRLPAGVPWGTKADILVSEPERVVLGTSSPRAGLLVLTDTHYPGWTADVDGAPAPILRVNFLFRGVVVPAGEHRVAFRYDPFSVRLGLCLGGAGIVAFLLLAASTMVLAGREGSSTKQPPA